MASKSSKKSQANKSNVSCNEAEFNSQVNFSVVKIADPDATRLIFIAGKACMFESEGADWAKLDFEGPLMVYERSSSPHYAFIILSHKKNEFRQYITTDMVVLNDDSKVLVSYTIPTHDRKSTVTMGVWFSDEKDFPELRTVLERLIKEVAIKESPATGVVAMLHKAFQAKKASVPAVTGAPTNPVHSNTANITSATSAPAVPYPSTVNSTTFHNTVATYPVAGAYSSAAQPTHTAGTVTLQGYHAPSHGEVHVASKTAPIAISPGGTSIRGNLASAAPQASLNQTPHINGASTVHPILAQPSSRSLPGMLETELHKQLLAEPASNQPNDRLQSLPVSIGGQVVDATLNLPLAGMAVITAHTTIGNTLPLSIYGSAPTSDAVSRASAVMAAPVSSLQGQYPVPVPHTLAGSSVLPPSSHQGTHTDGIFAGAAPEVARGPHVKRLSVSGASSTTAARVGLHHADGMRQPAPLPPTAIDLASVMFPSQPSLPTVYEPMSPVQAVPLTKEQLRTALLQAARDESLLQTLHNGYMEGFNRPRKS